MEQWYGLTQEEVLKRLSTNRTGLSEEEAEKRLEVYGENILKEQEEMPWWQIFLGQFKDLLVMILIGAAGVSMVTGDPESALVIFSVLLLNAILGTVQHQKARRSLESLKRLASTDTLLLREGRICMVPASKVVPGDILVLETGGIAAADGRILQATGLTCNESSLTGEALNVEKNEKSLFSQQEDIALGDQSNMVFSGALITGGRGTAVATATGMDTQIGKIVMEERKEHNPCSLCAKLRKGALVDEAVRQGCNVIAYAHHKDDFVETMLMSMIYQGQFYAFPPVTWFEDKGIRVIRPLMYVEEGQVRGFIRRQEIRILKSPCPVDGTTRRAYVKDLLMKLDRETPGAKERMFHAIVTGNIYDWVDPKITDTRKN